MGNISEELPRKRPVQPEARLAGKPVNVSPEAADALLKSAKEGLAGQSGAQDRADANAGLKPGWRTGGPGSPGEQGSGDGKPLGGLAPDAPVPPQPWYKRAWQWLKDQQGPSI